MSRAVRRSPCMIYWRRRQRGCNQRRQNRLRGSGGGVRTLLCRAVGRLYRYQHETAGNTYSRRAFPVCLRCEPEGSGMKPATPIIILPKRADGCGFNRLILPYDLASLGLYEFLIWSTLLQVGLFGLLGRLRNSSIAPNVRLRDVAFPVEFAKWARSCEQPRNRA